MMMMMMLRNNANQPPLDNYIQLDSLYLHEDFYANYVFIFNNISTQQQYNNNSGGSSSSSSNGNSNENFYERAGQNISYVSCFGGSQEWGAAISIILYGIVCLIGIFGNSLVIYVVLCFAKMQTVTNIYILNLAMADECFLIGIPLLLFTMYKGSWTFGEYLCKIYMVSTSITQFTSSIFLLIMSADRYIAVCHPIISPRFRNLKVAKCVCIAAWLTSALLMLPVILFATTIKMGDHVSCNIKWPEQHGTHSAAGFILYALALGFALPLFFISIFYFFVMRKLHAVELKHKSRDKRRSHRRVTRLVMVVVTVYILCWLPYWVAQLTLIFTPVASPNEGKCMSRLELFTFLIVGCLGYSNSAVNPLLYAFLSDNFKKSFMKAFNCGNKTHKNLQLQSRSEPRYLSRCCERCNQSMHLTGGVSATICQNRDQLTENIEKTTKIRELNAGISGQTMSTSLTDKCTGIIISETTKREQQQLIKKPKTTTQIAHNLSTVLQTDL